MGMTMTQKILAAHAGLESVKAGDLIEAKLDLVLGNDVTTPVAVDVFDKAGFDRVFDKDKIAIVLDHYTPCKDIKSAQLCKTARDFAHRFNITHFYDVGQVGIEHALLLKRASLPRARSSSARTATPAPTAQSARFPRAWAPPTWPPVWPRAKTGSRCPAPSRWC